MWFWYFMFICDLIIPLLMIICGRAMWKHPPGKINRVIGYRTSRSKKNADTWKFAHDYCGRLWWKIGWISLLPSVILHFPFYNKSENAIGTLGSVLCTIQCALLITSVFLTESVLKKNFTDEGLRK